MKEEKYEPLAEVIQRANGAELDEIAKAVIHRYGELFPEWEIHFVSMHRDAEKRKADMEKLIRFLECVEERRKNEESGG